MKIICFLLLFTTVSGAAQTGWYFLQSGTEQHLHSIFFSDVQTGWAVGDSATILKTNNGGNTWQTLNITRKVNQGSRLQLRAVWGVGTQEILVAGYVASVFASDTGIIIRTVDGGTTWNEVYSSYYSRIQQLHFISGTHGFASTVQSEFGQNQYLLETHDSGLTWDIKRKFEGADYGLTSCCFIDSLSYGYSVKTGPEPYYRYLGYVVRAGVEHQFMDKGKSVDFLPYKLAWCGGTTWILDVGAIPAPLKPKNRLAVTEDDGIRWKYDEDIFLGKSQSLLQPELLDLYSYENTTSIISITDANKNRRYHQLPTTAKNLNYVYAFTPKIGYCVGNTGVILKTIDGGGNVSGIEDFPSFSTDTDIYPNPADEILTITTDAHYTGAIVSLVGHKVMEFTSEGTTTDLDCRLLPTGMYILFINHEATITRHTLLIY